MSTDLSTQYENQDKWRRWDSIIPLLPLYNGQKVLDLGCGAGQVTARLEKCGAQPIGVDLNEELLQRARTVHPSIRFEKFDLLSLDEHSFGMVDGIWSSFVAAYFQELPKILTQWAKALVPLGWMALVEVDDLLGHGPIDPQIRSEIRAFYKASRVGGYQFECGRELSRAAKQAGLEVLLETQIADKEFNFGGPASKEILEAWQQRFSRMKGLQQFFGEKFPMIRDALLGALSSPVHQSSARVYLVIARKPE